MGPLFFWATVFLERTFLFSSTLNFIRLLLEIPSIHFICIYLKQLSFILENKYIWYKFYFPVLGIFNRISRLLFFCSAICLKNCKHFIWSFYFFVMACSHTFLVFWPITGNFSFIWTSVSMTFFQVWYYIQTTGGNWRCIPRTYEKRPFNGMLWGSSGKLFSTSPFSLCSL